LGDLLKAGPCDPKGTYPVFPQKHKEDANHNSQASAGSSK